MLRVFINGMLVMATLCTGAIIGIILISLAFVVGFMSTSCAFVIGMQVQASHHQKIIDDLTAEFEWRTFEQVSQEHDVGFKAGERSMQWRIHNGEEVSERWRLNEAYIAGIYSVGYECVPREDSPCAIVRMSTGSNYEPFINIRDYDLADHL